MDEDAISLSIGLLLTQVRSARRALEEVERNTSRYLGFEFMQALADGSRFGAPPLHQGALRVHVININDLAPGSSLGDVLMGLLGGIGNFIGGLVGGVVGGTVSGLALPLMIWKLEQITRSLREIVDRIGFRRNPAAAAAPATPASATAEAATPPAGETLLTTFSGVSDLLRQLTALFTLASSGGDTVPAGTAAANRAGRTAPEVLSVAGERWMVILTAVNQLLERVRSIVGGLIAAIPLVIGSIALLIANLAGIRNAILETMQFVVRNLLVLRGVLLTTIFETVASAARLASRIVALLSEAIRGALVAIFSLIDAVIGAAFDALSSLAQTLQSVIGRLLAWLVDGIFNALRAIGDLPVFRTIDHVVRIVPALLEPIYQIVVAFKTGTADGRFSTEIRDQLGRALDAGLPTTSGVPAAATPPTSGSPSDAVEALRNPPSITPDLEAMGATLRAAMTATQASLDSAVYRAFDEVGTSFNGIAGRFNRAITEEADFSRSLLERNLPELTRRADALAGAIDTPLTATGVPTGFEEISAAYEGWLTGGGLARTLDLATAQFRDSAAGSAPDRLGLMRGQFDRPRASVEIERVEIVIGEAANDENATGDPTGLLGPGIEAPLSDEDIWRACQRHNLDLETRCFRPNDIREMVA